MMECKAFVSKRALKDLKMLCLDMNIPIEAEKRAKKLYFYTLKNIRKTLGNVRVSHYSLLLISLSAVAKEMEIPFNLNKAIKVLRSRGNRVSRADIIRVVNILKEAEIPLNGRDLLDYYSSLVSKLTGVEREIIYLEAKKLVDNARRKLQGRNPHIIALAATYLALKTGYFRNTSIKISVERLSELTGHSSSSIRDCIKILRDANCF